VQSSPHLRNWRQASTVAEWIEGLNDFATAEITDYKRNTEAFLQSLYSGGDALTNSAGSSASGEGKTGPGMGVPATERIWESAGGYSHPQPGSRLVQYGKALINVLRLLYCR
jgi:hypothetical protein